MGEKETRPSQFSLTFDLKTFSGRELLKLQLSILTEPDEHPFFESLVSEDVDAAALEFTLLGDDTEDDDDILID